MNPALAKLVVIAVWRDRLGRSHILKKRFPGLGHTTLGSHQIQQPSCT